MEKKTTMLVAIVAVIVILLAAVGALYATGNLGGGGDENYTVSFVDGDNELSTLDVKDNSLVKQPADPVKDGYIFAGWYADSALTKTFDFKNTKITENTTIYAKFVSKDDKFTVSFNTDGGSSVASQTVNAGEKVTKPADPTKANNVFAGWYCDANLTEAYDFNAPVLSDLTLYAKWTAASGTYTVTFNSNGGSAVPSQTVKAGEQAVKPANPTKANSNFAGWYTDAQLTTQYNFNSPVNANITLYAKWTSTGGGGGGGPSGPTYYYVTFDANNTDATVNVSEPIKVKSGACISNLPTASYAGHAFLGWNTSNDGKGEVFTENTQVYSNKTVYAIWHDEKIVEVSAPAVGSGSVAKVTITTEIADELVQNANTNTISINADVDDANLPVQISKSDLSNLKTAMTDSTVDSLEFVTKDGSVELNSIAIEELCKDQQQDATISIIVKDVSDNAPTDISNTVGSNPVFEVSIKDASGNSISFPENSSFTITVAAPAGFDPTISKVFYVDDEGKLAQSFEYTYDETNKTITFTTSHNSHYAIFDALSYTVYSANTWLKTAGLDELFVFAQDTSDLAKIKINLTINADKVFGNDNALETIPAGTFDGFLTNFGKFVTEEFGESEISVQVNDVRENTEFNLIYDQTGINIDGVKNFILDFGYGFFEIISNMNPNNDLYSFKSINIVLGESEFVMDINFTGSGMDSIQSFAKTVADHISMSNTAEGVTITLTAPDALMKSVYDRVNSFGNPSGEENPDIEFIVWVLFNCNIKLDGVLSNIGNLSISDVFGSQNDAIERLVSICYSNPELINKVLNEITSVKYYCPDSFDATLSSYLEFRGIEDFKFTHNGEVCAGHSLLNEAPNFTMNTEGWNSFITAIKSMISPDALKTNPGNFYIGDGKYQIDVEVTLGLEELGLGEVPINFTLILEIFGKDIDDTVKSFIETNPKEDTP